MKKITFISYTVTVSIIYSPCQIMLYPQDLFDVLAHLFMSHCCRMEIPWPVMLPKEMACLLKSQSAHWQWWKKDLYPNVLTRRLVFLKILPHSSHLCYSEVNKCVASIHQLFNLVPLASFTSHTSCFLPWSSIFIMTVIFMTRTIAFSSLPSALSAPSPNHCYIIIISIIKVNTNGSLW